MKNNLESIAVKITEGVGSIWSVVAHTFIFLFFIILIILGYNADKVMLVLTTIVSLEAIYLSLFIQMTVNKHTEDIAEIAEDVDDIQEDIEDIQEDIEDIQEDVEDIQEDVDELSSEEETEEEKLDRERKEKERAEKKKRDEEDLIEKIERKEKELNELKNKLIEDRKN